MAKRSMTSEEILAAFAQLTAAPREGLIAWKKKNNKKIIGCFPMHIPEEIIHAAGMLPVVMWEGSAPITLGHAHISPYNCGIVRSVIDDGARGRLDVLDGFVSYETCLQARHLHFILQKTWKPAYGQRIFLPGVLAGEAARPFMIENLKRLKESLERFGRQEISPASLGQSIRAYNENRTLLRRLYQLRRRHPGLLKPAEVAAVVHASMLMPKEEHSVLLKQLLSALEEKQPEADQRCRVILSGSLCAAPQREILDLIEEAGMAVPDDDLYVGSRYFYHDTPTGKEPLQALSDRYFEKTPPCPTRSDPETDWCGYLVRMAQENRARGVISLVVKYCPPHIAYYADIERKLSRAGLHALMLEMEHEVTSIEQVRTRLQAFRESLEQG